MNFKKADILQRFLAALIDGAIGWVVIVIPFIGGILSFFYLLFKDGIMYQLTKDEEWKNKSIGKRILNLEIARLDGGGVVDLVVSAKRNLPLTIGSLIAVIPLIGWIVGGLVGLIFALVELFLIFSEKDGRRLGDRWASTIVFESEKKWIIADK